MNSYPQLILEKEILNGEIKSVLLYHSTDRLYFGDLLRHSAWIKSFEKAGVKVDVATNKNYLSIFENDPAVKKLLAIDKLSEKDFADYDLVVFPSSIDFGYYSPLVKRGIYSYNTGIKYTRYGLVIKTQTKDELNYFRLAEPQFGQSYLPDGAYYRMHLSPKEKAAAKKLLTKLFGSSAAKIIVLNPTASNIFTRENTVKKEVDNLLNKNDYLYLVQKVLDLFPKHQILLGSGLKPYDQENFDLLESLKKSFPDNRVQSITASTTLGKGISFRAFAAILSDSRLSGMLGNGTGTNTHLAATLGLPAMSLERGFDQEMIQNWRSSGTFQMGSFRWRNPDQRVATYTLNWSRKCATDFAKVARQFQIHLALNDKKLNFIFAQKYLPNLKKAASRFAHGLKTNDARLIVGAIKVLHSSFLEPAIRDYYFNFDDEQKYLEVTNKKSQQELVAVLSWRSKQKNLSSLTLNLLKDSNLYKLCRQISAEKNESKKTSQEELICRKLRAMSPLSKSELKSLGCKNETALSVWLNDRLGMAIDREIRNYRQTPQTMISGGWQQKIYCDTQKDYLLKHMSHNQQSIYFTEAWCQESLAVANTRAGGLIPAQTEVRNINRKYYHLAQKVRPLTRIQDLKENRLNGQLFTETDVTKVALPLGLIDSFLDNFLSLLDQGIYDVDARFVELAIDNWGVFANIDSGSFKNPRTLKTLSEPLKDPFRLGINQLAVNRVFFAKFKNSSELLSYYDRKIKQLMKIDVSTFPLDWQWGNHGALAIAPLAQKLQRFVQQKRNIKSRPVYPFISPEFEILIRKNIKQRLKLYGSKK